MGRRFWFGILLLLILIFLGIFSLVAVDTICSPLETTLLQAQSLALDGDLERAISLARQAKSDWESRRDLLAILADRSPMDDVEQLFAELEVYGKFQDETHFAGCCGSLAILCHAMVDSHAPAWPNLL